MLRALGGDGAAGLWNPHRCAVQIGIAATDPGRAVASALDRWRQATLGTELEGWEVARIEVLTPAELARELETETVDPVPATAGWGTGSTGGSAPGPSGSPGPLGRNTSDGLLDRAFCDPLTGLVNRELFLDGVRAALAGGPGARGAVLVVDVDDMAGINRDAGYDAGDRVLMIVATRLAAAGSGISVARVGGDQFALLADGLGTDDVEELAARLQHALAATVRLPGATVTVSACLGAAAFGPAEPVDGDELLRRASLAMCVAKAAGHGQHRWFQPTIEADTSRLDEHVDPAPDRLSYVLLLERAAAAANEGSDLAGAAQGMLREICAHTAWLAGQLSDPGPDGPSRTIVWHGPPGRLLALRQALASRPPGEPGNLVDSVLSTGRPAWLADPSSSPADWARQATLAGVRAAYAFPVRVGEEVVGILELFSAGSMQPDGSILDVMATVGIELGRIVERVRSRAAVARAEAACRSLAEVVPALVWRTGADGRVSYLNRRWLDFTGRPLDVELGDGWLDGVHPADRAEVLDVWRRAREQGETYEVSYRLRRADGGYSWVRAQGSPVTATGRLHGYVGTAVELAGDRARELPGESHLVH